MEEKEEGKRAYTRAHAFDLDIDIILAQLSNTIFQRLFLANTHSHTHARYYSSSSSSSLCLCLCLLLPLIL